MDDIKDKIKAIDTKISQLNKVYKEDIGASYKEASQTQDMITMLKRQKFEIQKEIEKGSAPSKNFKLQAPDGEAVIFNVVSSYPDRTKGEISAESPIGSQLINSSLNGTIDFKGKAFKIVSID